MLILALILANNIDLMSIHLQTLTTSSKLNALNYSTVLDTIKPIKFNRNLYDISLKGIARQK